jgi:hypothetical protein
LSNVVRLARPVPLALSSILCAAAISACGGGPGSDSFQDGTQSGLAMKPGAGSNAPVDVCETASEGCPCARDGETASCPAPAIHIGNYFTCQAGARACDKGQWGPCIARNIYEGRSQPTQDYSSPCPPGTSVRWHAVVLQGQSPLGSDVDVAVQTADTQVLLDSAPRTQVAAARFVADTPWSSGDVDAILYATGSPSRQWLRVILTPRPSPGGGSWPVVTARRVGSECVASSD